MRYPLSYTLRDHCGGLCTPAQTASNGASIKVPMLARLEHELPRYEYPIQNAPHSVAWVRSSPNVSDRASPNNYPALINSVHVRVEFPRKRLEECHHIRYMALLSTEYLGACQCQLQLETLP